MGKVFYCTFLSSFLRKFTKFFLISHVIEAIKFNDTKYLIIVNY